MTQTFILRNVLRTGANKGRVITREQAMDIGQRLLVMLNKPATGICIEHTAHAVTKVARGEVLSADDGDEIGVTFDSEYTNGLGVKIGTNQLNEETLRRVVQQSLDLMSKPADGASEEEKKYGEAQFLHDKREYLPVNLWHDSTAAAMESVRETAIPAMVGQLQSSGLEGAATVGIAARSTLYLYPAGMTAWMQETDSEVTVTARTPDARASGWSGQASRDWSRIDTSAIVRTAADMANRSRNAVAVEPGRRTVILSASAVGQLMRAMAPLFSAYASDSGQTMFSIPNLPPFDDTVRKNRIGQRMFSPRVNFKSDPQDPEGGYSPFGEVGGMVDPAGTPIKAMSWIENGVLKNLAYLTWYAMAKGKMWADVPFTGHLYATPGTPTSTIEEMIAQCQSGIYINRLSNVQVVDQKTGMMTGTTKDGCFLIKDGKIEKPVKNFWFLESPAFAFNNIEMMGTASRVAAGYFAASEEDSDSIANFPRMGQKSRWPLPPMITPPMMIKDFNLVSLADVV